MHKYIVLRAVPKLMRRVVEDLQDIYHNFKTKDGKRIGALQLGVREIKTYEVVFPQTEKKTIKAQIQKVVDRHNGAHGGVAIHWGPWKKDKFVDGVEQI